MKRILRYGLLVAGLGALAPVNAEQPRTEHAAHEHGHAVGSLAEDSGRWQLVLEIPGHNLVGFEHPPANAQQRDRLEAVRARLETGRWLRPDPESPCRVDSSRVETTGYAGSAGDGHHAQSAHGYHHDHSEQQAHGHEDHGGHGAFHVEAVISCDASGRMRWLTLDLFDGFPDNRSIRLDVLSEDGAASHRLDSEDFRIRFD